MKSRHIVLLVVSIGFGVLVAGIFLLFFVSQVVGYVFLDQGRLAYKSRDYERALTDFDWAITLLVPGNAQAYMDRGFVYRAIGKPDLAVADFNETLRLKPRADLAYDEMGQIHLQQKDYAEAIKDFSQSIVINPTSKWAYIHLGMAYQLTHQYDLALEDLNKGVAYSPELAFGWEQRGEVYFDRHELQKGIDDLSKAIEITPGPLDYSLRGTGYAALHDDAHALPDFDKAIELGTVWDGIYAARGRIFRRRGEHDRAQADFATAIRLNPKNGRNYVDRAMDFIATNQFPQALADCQQALQVGYQDEWVCNEVAWILSVSPHPEMRDGKRAVGLAQDACKMSAWKKPSAVDTLAAAYAETGDFTDAVNWEYYYLAIETDAASRTKGEGRLHSYQQHQPWRTEQY